MRVATGIFMLIPNDVWIGSVSVTRPTNSVMVVTIIVLTFHSSSALAPDDALTAAHPASHVVVQTTGTLTQPLRFVDKSRACATL